MNFYFFLVVPGFDCEIALANFAPDADVLAPIAARQVCSARPVDDGWEVACHGPIAAGEIRAVRPRDLGLSMEEAVSCLVFMAPEPISGRMDQLPRYPGFDTVPAWRANLRVIAPTTSVGYQGEYPAGMFDIRNPRLVSLCAMIQEGLANAILLASFTASAGSRRGRIRVNAAASGELFGEFAVWTNRVNHVDLGDLGDAARGELLLVSSDDVAGIPIFFSRDADGRHLSLEHTHPPAELTVFGALAHRTRVVQRMREAWLKRARHG